MAEAEITAAGPRELCPGGDAVKEWEGLLAPDERILWQGELLQGFVWTPVLQRVRPASLAIAPVVPCFLVLLPAEPGAGYSRLDVGLVVLFWLAVVLICFQAIGHFNRRRSFFALIGTRHFGIHSLREVPLFTDTPLRLVQGRWGAVYFARRARDRESGATVEDGFEGIAEPQEPYRLIAELRARPDGPPLAAQPASR